MEFYDNLGYLVFGSRLRRLSEYFIAEINKVYQEKGIPFDASWFPIFYILSQNPKVSLVEISQQLQTSHSAVSQLITNLKKKGLVELVKAEDDGRKQLVTLNEKGKQLLAEIQPIWQQISICMDQLGQEEPLVAHLLPGISEIESLFKQECLSQRILTLKK